MTIFHRLPFDVLNSSRELTKIFGGPFLHRWVSTLSNTLRRHTKEFTDFS